MRGIKVILRIKTRKFFCDNPECPKKIFVERFPGFLATSHRKTVRLDEMITRIGYFLGGNPGAEFCRRLGITVGKDTVLRRIKKEPASDDEEVDVVGIDDWAYKRGQRYGTIIVDLKRHKLIDLLPDRSVSTVAGWLSAHPKIRIVSRDRAGIYADAVRQGLPSAKQVADRWHLLKNFGDAVERHLAHYRLPAREEQHACEPKLQAVEPKKHSRREREEAIRHEAKWARVQHVQQLYKSGSGIRTISKQTGFARATIRKYLEWTEVPKTTRQPKATVLDPFKEQIIQLLEQPLSGHVILKKIRDQGYKGSRSTLSQYIADIRKLKRNGQEIVQKHYVSPRGAATILTRPLRNMNDEDKLYLTRLYKEIGGAKTIRKLILSFRKLMQQHNKAGLDKWILKAEKSKIKEIQNFARGIKKDYGAVASGIEETWSNGQVEGQVNRLKTIKRQMYGRASFPLLRARVLSRWGF